MKKLILSLFIIISLASCEEGFKTQRIDEHSQVPISYSDSSKWEKAKVYVVDDHKMYVQLHKETYEVNNTNRTLQLLMVLLILCVLITLISYIVS